MARERFPAPFPWSEILADALRRAGPSQGVRLFLEQREDLTLTWADGETSSVRSLSCGVSATRGGAVPELVYAADPTPDDVVRVATANAGPQGAPGPHPWSLARLDGEDARLALRRIGDALAHMAPGARVRATAVEFEQHVWVAGADIGCREDHRRSARLRVEIESGRGGRSARAVGEIVRGPAGGSDGGSLDRLAAELAERLDRGFDRRDPPSGESVAVLAPGIGGILAHEIVGHALESDTVRARASWLAALAGPVGPRDLRVVDDPRRGRAAWRIDDDGIEARATALIDGGCVVGALHDRTSAARDGARPTGHGRRASFREPVMPRMGCTYIAAGRAHANEILSSVERGVYIRRMEAASVDPRSGRAVFRVTDSDEVIDGRIAAPLFPYLWIVDGPCALASLQRIADDLEFDSCIGSCHRDGQALAISVGAPTICIGVSRVKAANSIVSAEG